MAANTAPETTTRCRRREISENMLAEARNRVAHPFAHFAKGWGIARCVTVLLCAAVASCTFAQGNACALTAIRHSAQLAYPPIAIVAHMTGDVGLRAHIADDGSVTSVEAASGPEMLKQTAKNYVASWQTNEHAGEQECSIVVSFRIEGEYGCYFRPSVVKMTDLQHFIVATNPIQTCDPSATITFTRHRILFFHWNSKPVRHVND
jgi:hypothetical protein